jgi:hypothetical protein
MHIRPAILLFLSLITFFSVNPVAAQNRFVDFEAECLYPKGTYENGSYGLLRFNGINHGPDAIQAGDSLWYILYDYIDGQMGEIYYQGPLRLPDVPVGEKFYYQDNYNILLYFPDVTEPKQVQFCTRLVNYHLTGNLDTIFFSHKDTVAFNDSCCQTLTILPIPTDITSLRDEDKSIQIHPNPSDGKFQLVLDGAWVHQKRIIAKVYDLSGKLVHQCNVSRNGQQPFSLPIDLGKQLPSGIYMMHVQSDDLRVIKKLVIR